MNERWKITLRSKEGQTEVVRLSAALNEDDAVRWARSDASADYPRVRAWTVIAVEALRP